MSSPDFVVLAKQRYGLDQAVYPATTALRHLGYGRARGWEQLISTGKLPSFLMSDRKRVVRAADIAKLLYEREIAHAALTVPPSKGRRGLGKSGLVVE